MPTSTQEQRGSGLSSTLVKDFRAILDALEQEKATRPASAPAEKVLAHAPDAAAETTRPLVMRREPAEKPSPAPYAEVRSRIAALGDVRDMFPSRAAAEPVAAPVPLSSEAQPVPAQLRPAALRPVQQTLAEATNADARRRGFGVAARCAEGETPARRRRSSSKDAFTWQRLAVLAAFMAIAGGGAVALQSVVGREEAKVAPEAIGNAAIASVAPSAPLPVAAATEPAVVPTNLPFAVAPTPQPSPAPSVSAVVAEVPQPTLRNAEPLFETSPASVDVPGVTAFAPVANGTAPRPAAADAPKTTATLPAEAPLPPPAPPKPAMVAAVTPAAAPVAAAADTESAHAGEDDGAADASGFGGEPVGTITLRSAVTMRAAPKKGSTPVGNLSGGQKVELVACTSWCEVIAEGKRGFIYKSFVDVSAVKPIETATP